MEYVENLIVGGGFTGMLLAQKLPNASLVSEEVGGLIKNTKLGGFSFDIGGHVYTTGDPRVVELMKESKGVLHDNRKAVYLPYDYETKQVPYPVQAFADELGIKLKGHRNPPKDATSLADYVAYVFGTEFYTQWYYPFNRRVWSTEPVLMDYDWIHGRVQLPSEDKKNWGMNASFWYAPGDEIIKTMLEKIPNDVMFQQGRLYFVDLREHTAHFKDQAGNFLKIKYDRLFNTTPHFLPHMKRNNVYSIGIGFADELPYDFHWAYTRFSSDVHRVTLLSRYHPSNAIAGRDSLLLEIPFFPGEKDNPYAKMIVDNHLPDSDLISCAHKLLDSAGFGSAIGHKIIAVWGKETLGYPIPTLGSRDHVALTKRQLLKQDVYLAGRWGAHLYANLQHLYDDVDSVIDQMQSEEPLDNYLKSAFYYKH